jgi:hypothetical protein
VSLVLNKTRCLSSASVSVHRNENNYHGYCILIFQNKVYPRELDHRDPKVRGRIRVQLRDENGGFLMPEYKTSKTLYCGLISV